jgi:hypothetical protein
MDQTLENSIALLARTPATLNALLRDLPAAWTECNEGEKTWSAYDIVGHLIHGEKTDWIPRAKIILQYGETRAFDPFDRLAQFRDSAGKSLPELLDEFAVLRMQNLVELKALRLGPQELARRGKHPALGTVTLSELMAAWVGHDLTHIHQLSRVMARQYRAATGPWSAYLGVLKCEGHSS